MKHLQPQGRFQCVQIHGKLGEAPSVRPVSKAELAAMSSLSAGGTSLYLRTWLKTGTCLSEQCCLGLLQLCCALPGHLHRGCLATARLVRLQHSSCRAGTWLGPLLLLLISAALSQSPSLHPYVPSRAL